MLKGEYMGASQDFKGTINGNTITAGTGTLTLGAGLTLTGDETIAISAKATQGVWTDYAASSTIAGFSGGVVKTIRYLTLGKLVFVDYYLDATSNQTYLTFTVPFASANTAVTFDGVITQVQDNSVDIAVPGKSVLAVNSDIVTCYKTVAGGAWTASGNKIAHGSFWYVVP